MVSHKRDYCSLMSQPFFLLWMPDLSSFLSFLSLPIKKRLVHKTTVIVPRMRDLKVTSKMVSQKGLALFGR